MKQCISRRITIWILEYKKMKMTYIIIPTLLCFCAMGAGVVCMCNVFPLQMAVVGTTCLAGAVMMLYQMRRRLA